MTIKQGLLWRRSHFLSFRVDLVPKGLIHGLCPIQSNPAHPRPPRCALALAWILQLGITNYEWLQPSPPVRMAWHALIPNSQFLILIDRHGRF